MEVQQVEKLVSEQGAELAILKVTASAELERSRELVEVGTWLPERRDTSQQLSAMRAESEKRRAHELELKTLLRATVGERDDALRRAEALEAEVRSLKADREQLYKKDNELREIEVRSLAGSRSSNAV